jgi:hypothetical protein
MAIDTDRIDDAVLALLHLALQDQSRAGKAFDSDALGRLHRKGMIDDPAGDLKSVALTDNGMQRSKQLFESMFTRQAAQVAGQSKYPHIKVNLADLEGQLWPILRRVSYAMSDADVNEADIEQYKVEVRAGDDPVAVSSRWVHVERAAD